MTEDEKTYGVIISLDTAKKLVDSVIASRATGEVYPLSPEDYALLVLEVEEAEKHAAKSGESVYKVLQERLAAGVVPQYH